ncbi:MAG TPA: DUF1499 domain-containing protein [Thermoanaerobaculia bacterium]|nr:DUF1499 domain-containing protein [Thermoanaerobaculia bacterium]
MLIRTATILATAAVASLALSGPGTRWNWWSYRVGLLLFAVAGLVGLLAAVTGFLARRSASPNSQRARLADFAIVMGLVSFAVPIYGVISARRVPPIHDITTSLDDPPHFRAALTARGSQSNPAPDTIAPDVAQKHRAGYPTLQPLVLPMNPDQALDRAVEVARSLRWRVIAVDRNARTVEATATTAWFGFRDDVVVRIRPVPGGSRIDVRSTSRVGRSDAGVNANRIRRFLRLMQPTR